MENVNPIAELFNNYGIGIGLLTLLIALLIMRGGKIWNWFEQTIKAAETVRLHEETITELKRGMEEMRLGYETKMTSMQEQLDKNNDLILAQTATIARLEERLHRYEDLIAKKTASPRSKRQ